jgi:hypothetical protein
MLSRLILRREHAVQDWIYLLLGLSFAGFAVYWIVLIIG